MTTDPGRPIKETSIPFLLHEYDTLRMEMTHKTNNQFQLIVGTLGALVVTGTWLSGHRAHLWLAALWIIAVLVVLGFIARHLEEDLLEAAARIRCIEEEVDEAAGEWYLLRHERLTGGAKHGLWRWPFRKITAPVAPPRSSLQINPNSTNRPDDV